MLLGADEQMADDLPANEYYEYYGPDYKLHVPETKDVPNANKREYLEKVGFCLNIKRIIYHDVKSIQMLHFPGRGTYQRQQARVPVEGAVVRLPNTLNVVMLNLIRMLHMPG